MNFNIPKIIHQTWKDKILPEWSIKYNNSWKNDYPDWELRLYDDNDNDNFIKENYPDYLYFYNKLPHKIQKIDLIRIFYLYHYGGMYIDLDFESIKNIDSLFNMIHEKKANSILDYNNIGLILSEEWPESYNTGSLSNAIMISKKNHPFWLCCIHEIISNLNIIRRQNNALKLQIYSRYGSMK